MRSERFDKRLPEDGLPAQTRLLLPVSPYSMCHYYCENSQVFSLERADIECWWKSFPLRLWPQLTYQDLWWVSTLLLTSLIPFTKISDGWAHSLSIVITGITHQNLWLVSMFLIDSTHWYYSPIVVLTELLIHIWFRTPPLLREWIFSICSV